MVTGLTAAVGSINNARTDPLLESRYASMQRKESNNCSKCLKREENSIRYNIVNVQFIRGSHGLDYDHDSGLRLSLTAVVVEDLPTGKLEVTGLALPTPDILGEY